jgi:hypothetical protein
MTLLFILIEKLVSIIVELMFKFTSDLAKLYLLVLGRKINDSGRTRFNLKTT